MDPSITTWIGLLKAGEDQAAQQLWERFFPQLVEVARQRLRGLSRREADEEDVALSAFHAFYRAAVSGRIPQLSDRDDLWRTLVLITNGKAIDQRRHQLADKRGGQSTPSTSLESAPTREPDPAFAVMIADQCQLLLDQLPDDHMRQIALLRLEGHTHEEIAGRLRCSVRTVKRRVALIRRTWAESAL